MLNQSHVYISRQAEQFQQALMQVAQGRQQRSHLSSVSTTVKLSPEMLARSIPPLGEAVARVA
jgi:hypothetical protein